MSWVEELIDLGRKCLNDGMALEDHRLPEVLLMFVEGDSMLQWEAKSPVHQLLATRCPADLE